MIKNVQVFFSVDMIYNHVLVLCLVNPKLIPAFLNHSMIISMENA